tara:strand:- start:4279 stop:4731 length:453 start_codon:yes stop_codon:yes gene_type:complete
MKDRLMADLKTAMKEKNPPIREIIADIRGSIKNKEVELRREISDSEIVSVIKKTCKELNESALAFTEAGLDYQDQLLESLVKLEQAQKYLPQEISPTELESIVVYICRDKTIKEMGKCIGEVKAEVERLGFDCDGGQVARFVKGVLTAGE